MSEEQLKVLLEKVEGDISLQKKLKAAADTKAGADTNAVLEIAKEVGFIISDDDLTNAPSKLSEKLSEEELEDVAGGRKRMVDWCRPL